MWTRIIKYQNFVRFGVHLGAKMGESSKNHLLNFLILGERASKPIFRLDKMVLAYFFNKNLINKISRNNARFLFLTSRTEYYSVIKSGAEMCDQAALLWEPAVLTNLKIRIEAAALVYGGLKKIPDAAMFPSVFVLFDNEKFKSKRIMSELSKFHHIPMITVLDTDSILTPSAVPIVGNDDSSVAIYFYSFFVVHSIISSKKILDEFSYETRTTDEN